MTKLVQFIQFMHEATRMFHDLALALSLTLSRSCAHAHAHTHKAGANRFQRLAPTAQLAGGCAQRERESTFACNDTGHRRSRRQTCDTHVHIAFAHVCRNVVCRQEHQSHLLSARRRAACALGATCGERGSSPRGWQAGQRVGHGAGAGAGGDRTGTSLQWAMSTRSGRL